LDILGRKKTFGVDYIDLKLKEGTTEEDLNACVQSAIDDIEALEKKIEGYNEDIDKAKEEQETTTQANIEEAKAVKSPTKTPVGSPTKEDKEEAPTATKDEETPAATKDEEAPAATKEEEAPTSSTA